MTTWSFLNVPGYCGFSGLYAEAVDRAPRVGARFVEVGVMFGWSTFAGTESLLRSYLLKIKVDGVIAGYDYIASCPPVREAFVMVFGSDFEIRQSSVMHVVRRKS